MHFSLSHFLPTQKQKNPMISFIQIISILISFLLNVAVNVTFAVYLRDFEGDAGAVAEVLDEVNVVEPIKFAVVCVEFDAIVEFVAEYYSVPDCIGTIFNGIGREKKSGY